MVSSIRLLLCKRPFSSDLEAPAEAGPEADWPADLALTDERDDLSRSGPISRMDSGWLAHVELNWVVRVSDAVLAAKRRKW